MGYEWSDFLKKNKADTARSLIDLFTDTAAIV